MSTIGYRIICHSITLYDIKYMLDSIFTFFNWLRKDYSSHRFLFIYMCRFAARNCTSFSELHNLCICSNWNRDAALTARRLKKEAVVNMSIFTPYLYWHECNDRADMIDADARLIIFPSIVSIFHNNDKYL